MSKMVISPYDGTSGPAPGSVRVTVIVLAKDEELNIERCLRSVAWAEQRIVVDSGSSDATLALARGCGATVLEHEWRGFAAQREWALRHPEVEHDLAFFVDADEWVSPQLASEIQTCVHGDSAAYRLRYRLVFEGRWIRHCGWYDGSWILRLMRRSKCRYDVGEKFAERAHVDGPVLTLHNDLVDEDRKGLAAWMHKHVRYAELEAERRLSRPGLGTRLARTRDGRRAVALARYFLKEIVYPAVPAKPVSLFVYMYLIRIGFLDGRPGFRFCLMHAWHEHNIGALLATRRRAQQGGPG